MASLRSEMLRLASLLPKSREAILQTVAQIDQEAAGVSHTATYRDLAVEQGLNPGEMKWIHMGGRPFVLIGRPRRGKGFYRGEMFGTLKEIRSYWPGGPADGFDVVTFISSAAEMEQEMKQLLLTGHIH